MDPRESAAIFATTRWSLVRAAGCGSSASAQEALDQLCRAYWPPVYAFARRTGHKPEDSRDLTQSFFARLISTRSMDRANPAQGRFRSFLLGAFKHFLADEHDRELTQKRGGHVEFLPLDLALTESRFGGEPSTCATPDRAFDRAWALAVIDRALTRLREEFEMSGRGPLFEGLKGFLPMPSVLTIQHLQKLAWRQDSDVGVLVEHKQVLIPGEITSTFAAIVGENEVHNASLSPGSRQAYSPA